MLSDRCLYRWSGSDAIGAPTAVVGLQQGPQGMHFIPIRTPNYDNFLLFFMFVSCRCWEGIQRGFPPEKQAVREGMGERLVPPMLGDVVTQPSNCNDPPSYHTNKIPVLNKTNAIQHQISKTGKQDPTDTYLEPNDYCLNRYRSIDLSIDWLWVLYNAFTPLAYIQYTPTAGLWLQGTKCPEKEEKN